MAVVSGGTSAQSAYAPAIVEFLQTAGAAADLLHLPDYGIYGGGHGLIYERTLIRLLSLSCNGWRRMPMHNLEQTESPKVALS